MLTLQELHDRLFSYYTNVEKKKFMFTNNDYTLFSGFNPEALKEVKIKIGSLIEPLEFYRHIAIFFSELDFQEIYCIPQLLNLYIDNDEFKTIKVSSVLLHEDGREINETQIVFTGKIFIEVNNLVIDRNVAYSILKEMDLKYKGHSLSFSIRDNTNWEKLDRSRYPAVFLCHDSKDKKFVTQLYYALQKKFVNAWLDQFELKIGDSLLEKINTGLNQTSFGVIVISKSFLANDKWVKYELQSLISKQIFSNEKKILPIWLDITENDLENHHWLRDKLAVKSEEGINEIANKIVSVVYES